MLELPVNESIPACMLARVSEFEFHGSSVWRSQDLQEQEELQSDLTLARAVQQRMLPRNTKALTTITCAGKSAAARSVGGDYYDFLDLGADRLGILLADVSGKGVAAALLMANLQAAIRCECARGFSDLGSMLQRVNSQLLESTLPEQYATMFFGQYDDQTRRLDYINCGQQPAFVVRCDGSVERLEPTALPLGLFRTWAGETKSVELRSGDMLCICSDGIVEAGLENGAEFGEENLMSLAVENRGADIATSIARISSAASLYLPGRQSDDMTIVGVRAV